MAFKIKKGDKVIVLSGKNKGVVGEVLKIIPEKKRAMVRGVNIVKKLMNYQTLWANFFKILTKNLQKNGNSLINFLRKKIFQGKNAFYCLLKHWQKL